ALGAEHRGFEVIDVGAAYLVELLDLNGIPIVHKTEFDVFAFFWRGAYGINASVDAHVADLSLIGNAAQRDDRPIFELEMRHLAEFVFRPGKVAHDEAVAVSPVNFVLTKFAHISHALGHDTASGGRHVYSDPLSSKILRCD